MQEGRPLSCGSERLERLDLKVQTLLVCQVTSGKLYGLNLKIQSGSREKISRHVDALLVLNDKVEFQGKLLKLCQGFCWLDRPHKFACDWGTG